MCWCESNVSDEMQRLAEDALDLARANLTAWQDQAAMSDTLSYDKAERDIIALEKKIKDLSAYAAEIAAGQDW